MRLLRKKIYYLIKSIKTFATEKLSNWISDIGSLNKSKSQTKSVKPKYTKLTTNELN